MLWIKYQRMMGVSIGVMLLVVVVEEAVEVDGVVEVVEGVEGEGEVVEEDEVEVVVVEEVETIKEDILLLYVMLYLHDLGGGRMGGVGGCGVGAGVWVRGGGGRVDRDMARKVGRRV